MSTNFVPAGVKRTVACEICAEEISHDVVRVDEGRVYHLRCFRRHVHGEEIGLFECPKCRTLGSSWDWRGHAWRACTLCGGSGYLAAGDEACGN